MALEPPHVVKVEESFLSTHDQVFESVRAVKTELLALGGSNLVVLHAHACLEGQRLTAVIQEFLPEFRSNVHIYGNEHDSKCSNQRNAT